MAIKIYRVKYLEKFRGESQWGASEMNVATHGDATMAIKRARKQVVGTRVPVDDTGRTTVVTAIKPRGVELIAEADF
jgi:hypothetical protein